MRKKEIYTLFDFVKELKKNNININFLFSALNNKTKNKIEKAMKNDNKYVVFILLNENLKKYYNKNLLNRSMINISKKLKINKNNIIIMYFKELKKVIPAIYLINETPIYVFFEKRKSKDKNIIKFIDLETGYLV